MDCRQYLNCWRGRGTIQSCAPGTMFNPRTKECDNPSKVKCGHYEGLSSSNQRQSPPALNQRFSQRQEFAPIECERGASGLFANPSDCTKFLNCDHGRTFHQDCGPGTAFNDVFKVCDWPHKVNCGDRPFNGVSNGYSNVNSNTNTNTNSYSNHNTNSYQPNSNPYSNTNENSRPNSYTNHNSNPNTGTFSNSRDEPFYGEGLMDTRMDTSSRAHSQPSYPHHHQHNPSNRPYQPPQFPRNNIRNYQQSNGQQHQSNDGINSLNSFSSSPSFTATTINEDLHSNGQYADHTAQESSPKTQIVQIPSQVLLPPLGTTLSSDRSGRVDENFQGRVDSRLDWGNTGNSLDSTTRPTQIDDALLTQKKTENTPQQFPELNFMSSRVADDFNKYFSNPQPNTMPKSLTPTTTPPPTTTERQPPTVTKVYSVYPSGFETIGSRCEEDRAGLHAHPYDCSRYVSCENGRITVESCQPGSMFNPTLKICDFASNVKNCNARPMEEDKFYATETTRNEPTEFDNGQHAFDGRQNSFSELPDDSINEIYGDNKQKKSKTTTPAARSGFSQTTQATPTNPTAYFIPDMSVLPLENRRYPSNLYPDEPKSQTGNQKPLTPQQGWQHSYPGSQNLLPERQNPKPGQRQKPQTPQNTPFDQQNRQNPLYADLDEPSRGGDIEPDTFESRNFEVITSRSRDGKGLLHTTEPIQSTTESRNVMKISSGQEHVMPIYHRSNKPATTTTTTPRPYSSPQNYNHIYYQPFTRPINETQEKDETDYIPISEALKYLLRPYIAKNDTNTPENTEQMTKIEDKLLDMIDDGSKKHGKALEQDSLASAILNENVAVKNLPESPKTELRSDIELMASTTERRNVEETTSHSNHDIPPAAHFQPHKHNSHHHLPSQSSSPFARDFKHSPEFHAQHPELKYPTYYKPGTNDPVPITFPGAHTESRPAFGTYHNPSNPSEHGPSPSHPTTQMHSSHFHNGHPHFGPNYHTNAPNFGWAQNNRNTEQTTPTTASVPSPNLLSNQEKPTTASRFGKTQYGEVSTCDGQFDCGTGFCIPFSQVSKESREKY